MAPSQQPRIPTVKKETRKVREFPPRLESAMTVRSVPGATELQLVRQQRPKPKVQRLPVLQRAANLGAPAMPKGLHSIVRAGATVSLGEGADADALAR